MKDYIYLIKDLGFPIAMCLYFMFINNGTIKKNTEALNGIKLAVQYCPNNSQLKGGIMK